MYLGKTLPIVKLKNIYATCNSKRLPLPTAFHEISKFELLALPPVIQNIVLEYVKGPSIFLTRPWRYDSIDEWEYPYLATVKTHRLFDHSCKSRIQQGCLLYQGAMESQFQTFDGRKWSNHTNVPLSLSPGTSFLCYGRSYLIREGSDGIKVFEYFTQRDPELLLHLVNISRIDQLVVSNVNQHYYMLTMQRFENKIFLIEFDCDWKIVARIQLPHQLEDLDNQHIINVKGNVLLYRGWTTEGVSGTGARVYSRCNKNVHLYNVLTNKWHKLDWEWMLPLGDSKLFSVDDNFFALIHPSFLYFLNPQTSFEWKKIALLDEVYSIGQAAIL